VDNVVVPVDGVVVPVDGVVVSVGVDGGVVVKVGEVVNSVTVVDAVVVAGVTVVTSVTAVDDCVDRGIVVGRVEKVDGVVVGSTIVQDRSMKFPTDILSTAASKLIWTSSLNNPNGVVISTRSLPPTNTMVLS